MGSGARGVPRWLLAQLSRAAVATAGRERLARSASPGTYGAETMSRDRKQWHHPRRRGYSHDVKLSMKPFQERASDGDAPRMSSTSVGHVLGSELHEAGSIRGGVLRSGGCKIEQLRHGRCNKPSLEKATSTRGDWVDPVGGI